MDLPELPFPLTASRAEVWQRDEFSPAQEPMVVSVVTRGVSDDANAFVAPERSGFEAQSPTGDGCTVAFTEIRFMTVHSNIWSCLGSQYTGECRRRRGPGVQAVHNFRHRYGRRMPLTAGDRTVPRTANSRASRHRSSREDEPNETVVCSN